ncbi:serine threonine protein kinase : Serine/threonine protein kinase with TPR repeats OS=Koribacter versatilis (strain Ellin345) GN=Acid345_2310 PE=3 SV=1: Pkinase [Gemmata massiliana]|uniref:Protein kinase domain-containing protein n=1 Tax=Gemmata massiliana TaxID=1210884 RepID=A0A6P2CRF0_9BACT|nr:serine/threonine-protein kinase [Gemmata massiliana]VTR91648.1 serine threonine protein kinase : Serine/threonine protein kinase with TPR repeats OS=Koribacter versatilis (strain Ellin345) GN=Acid345_2310 PE=3 SV=1: Pkinase [Gemmata massiliana]
MVHRTGNESAVEPRNDGIAGGADLARDWSRLVGTGGEPAPDSRTRAAETGTGLEGRGVYRLTACLGAGGFGEVWRAEQVEPVARAVAVKLIRPGLRSAGVLARFGAERRALARMTHPNIARVYDAGTAGDGRPFFAMELVEGGVPVTAYCDAHALNIRARLELFLPVCAALHHAHQKGLIHRDVKPSNVLIGPGEGSPVPKVIDFGVAKALGDTWETGEQLTVAGEVVGTPAYMSPEQARAGGDVDVRSDVYGLGALLYDLLAGSPPFVVAAGTHPANVFDMIGAFEVPAPATRLGAESSEARATLAARRGTEPGSLLRSLRGELEWVVLRALARDPAERYSDAEALAADVRRYLRDEPVAAAPPSIRYRVRKWVRRHRRAVSVLAVILFGAAGYAGAEYRTAARTRFVEREGPAEMLAAWEEPPQTRLARLEPLRARLDQHAPAPRERTWSVLLDLMIGFARHLQGDDARARDAFTVALTELEGRVEPDPQHRAARQLLLQLGYAARAVAHEGLARRSLPIETTLGPERMPDRATVAAGAADFAWCYADLERTRSLRATGGWILGARDTEQLLNSAEAARGLVLARTRFYLVKGLLERGHWEETLHVARILDRCDTLMAGEGHYDVACAFAVAYGHTKNTDDADRAVKHLRAARQLGFGRDAVQAAMGTIRGSLKSHLANDLDVNSLRHHPDFIVFEKQLGADAATR